MAFLSAPAKLPMQRTRVAICSGVRTFSMKKKRASPKPVPEQPDPDKTNPTFAEEKVPQQPSQARLPEDMLLEDVKKLRAKRKAAPETPKKGPAPLARLKSAVETLLLWDFFLVLGLLGWLAVALIPHFASKNDVLLDPWLALWQPFIQPVLGVLMLGTIVQGTASFIGKN